MGQSYRELVLTTTTPNIWRWSATGSVCSFSLFPRPHRHRFCGVSVTMRLGNLRLSIQMSPFRYAHMCTVVSMLLQPVRWRAISCQRDRWSYNLYQDPKIRSTSCGVPRGASGNLSIAGSTSVMASLRPLVRSIQQGARTARHGYSLAILHASGG